MIDSRYVGTTSFIVVSHQFTVVVPSHQSLVFLFSVINGFTFTGIIVCGVC